MIPEIPPQVMAALADTPFALLMVWMLHGLRRDLAARLDPPAPAAHPCPSPHAAAEELAAFKLEVARSYVPLSLIRDLDARLTQQLGRLEAKLDEVSQAATAAAVSAQALPPRRVGFGLRAAGETEA